MTEKWLNDEELTAKIAALEENYKIVTENVAQAAIKSGRKPEVTVYDGTKSTQIGFATTEAWKKGGIVKIEY